MKLVSYTSCGQPWVGALVDGGIAGLFKGSLRRALAGNRMEELREMAQNRRPDLALRDVTLLPVIPDPGKILCIGLNYANIPRAVTGIRDGPGRRARSVCCLWHEP